MERQRFELLLTPELLAALDRWRKERPIPVSRAAAIRYMIELVAGKPQEERAP